MNTLPLDTKENGLEVVGGKGRSLSRLCNAGFNVPAGFQVPTAAYRGFVTDHELQEKILELAIPVIVEGGISFEQASTNIRQLFAEHDLSTDVITDIRAAYDALPGTPAVAVRSSANAEDLPDLSFAGQQDTYLNVTGGDAVAVAVKNCWASLWTAQAINYRHEMGIEQDVVAMAVVVQIMIPSDVSGILFTANPSTGERAEMIVNGSFGLGEAVVSGQVTPDTYIVDRETLTAKETIIGAKEQKIVSDGEQGTRMVDIADNEKAQSSISDESLRELVTLAIQVEETFDNVPQDIEWAIFEDGLWLLQARPITNLPQDSPKDVTWPEIPGAVLLKRQVAENMPDPLSPLFEELYLFAIYDTQTWPEGWEWNGSKTKNYMKNFVVATVNGYAYQAIYNINGEDWLDYMEKHKQKQAKQPWYVTLKQSISQGQYMIDSMKDGPLHFVFVIMRAFRTFKRYPTLVTWEKEWLPNYLAVIERWENLDPSLATGEELLTGMKSLTRAEGKYWHALRGVIGTAKGTDGAFQTFLEENAADEGLISGTFLSGFPSKTLEAEVAMRAIAQRINNNRSLYELTVITPATRFLAQLDQHPDGQPVRDAIDKYLYDFGRQVFNLDFVEPSLAEQPLPFVMSLKAMVRNPGYDLATRQQEVARTRREKWKQALRFFKGSQRLEFLRLYWTARVNYPTREEALFYMGLAWSTFRPWAQELGERLVSIGTLSTPDDLYYLSSEDLEFAIHARADNRAMPELIEKAQQQRQLRNQRFRMNQPPSIPLSKTDATFKVSSDNENLLRGFAVSPGSVTGIASVIMTPNDFDKMTPDSILVCPLTTPAWTQLFPHARGLVTDIGSILAHGSIVAREYGIPGVLGVGDATQRIKNGQTIAVDGDRGTVTILD
jgi:phosphohistidine swiveling domain-containing protein